MLKTLKLLALEEWIRSGIANNAFSRLRFSGIYPHKRNVISGKIFSNSIPGHPDERR